MQERYTSSEAETKHHKSMPSLSKERCTEQKGVGSIGGQRAQASQSVVFRSDKPLTDDRVHAS